MGVGDNMKLKDLEYFNSGYPRAFHFRPSEYYACNKNFSFEEWEKIFVNLSGIMGKVTKEEPYLPHPIFFDPKYHYDGLRDKAKDFFVRFKKRHPKQMVLLHYEGDDRDKGDNIEPFFDGHWIYFNGCLVTKDLLAEEGETEIHVEDPTLFHVNVGWGPGGWGDFQSKGPYNEDVGICMLGDDGKPDWNRCEQVKLSAVDLERKVIKVKRGCFGTKPRKFPANKTYIASHAFVDWGGLTPEIAWQYNFSTLCPKDPQGRTATDILLKELVTRFSPDGDLEVFDGIEFDVLSHDPDIHFWNYGRGLDTTGDGKADYGFVNGINYYGIGVYNFLKLLRRGLGEDRIIQADGGPRGGDKDPYDVQYTHQRGFGVLNGIESEGWPTQMNILIADWSGGLNNHLFWEQNARKPVFNYIAHKCWLPKVKGEKTRKIAPWNIHRLIFAAAQFMDAGICYFGPPPHEPGEVFGVWDELKKGIEHKTGWLDQPIAPAVHLALKEKDLLNNAGKKMSKEFVRKFQGDFTKFAQENSGVIINSNHRRKQLVFRLKDVPCKGPDLFISFKIKAEPMDHYPIDIARQVWFRLVYPDGTKSKERYMTWCNPNWFESNFFFREAKAGKVDLEFTVENSEQIWLTDLSVHAHSDAMYRLFEGGLVIANPSNHDYTFDIEKIDPNRKYRRLIGSSKQDTKTNDGSPIGKTVILKPLDGLFLSTTK
jgi:hypothetical protein